MNPANALETHEWHYHLTSLASERCQSPKQNIGGGGGGVTHNGAALSGGRTCLACGRPREFMGPLRGAPARTRPRAGGGGGGCRPRVAAAAANAKAAPWRWSHGRGLRAEPPAGFAKPRGLPARPRRQTDQRNSWATPTRRVAPDQTAKRLQLPSVQGPP